MSRSKVEGSCAEELKYINVEDCTHEVQVLSVHGLADHHS